MTVRASGVLDDWGDISSASAELRVLARAVRMLGDGYRTDPESIAIAKSEIAHRLVKLAIRLEGAR
ncbi:hypothetical protein [Oceanibaculum sp.]|uniref:hypothetical protein n=1 Tax=Oceanibaculum sp. TaxID=1903597 RepID=UPI002584AAD1|nr:hypothetical protein [Oceanibaculum sp.]MCH2394314.1 hypothetical protein [Oceanibaculum sp.]